LHRRQQNVFWQILIFSNFNVIIWYFIVNVGIADICLPHDREGQVLPLLPVEQLGPMVIIFGRNIIYLIRVNSARRDAGVIVLPLILGVSYTEHLGPIKLEVWGEAMV
jgi:hypothetical protein